MLQNHISVSYRESRKSEFVLWDFYVLNLISYFAVFSELHE
jgi:hypothetical protein